MRGLALVVIGLLAACEEGVVLEVHVPPGSQATAVRLFVGFEQCFDARGNACPGVAPPPTTMTAIREVLPGHVYHREPLDDQMVREAKIEGGVARFRIEAAGGATKLPFAVAIDDLQESAQYIPEISLDGARKYRIDMAPAMRGVLGRPPMPTINVVEIWNQPTKMLPCMGFERWREGSLVDDRVFVVPSDDPDCDEITTNECAPYAYKGTKPPTVEQSSCIAPFSFNDATTCRLGGMGCTEVAGAPTQACAPSEYCLPSHYCDKVNNPICVDPVGFVNMVKCLFESPPPPAAKLVCTVGIKPSGDNTHFDLCQSTISIDSTMNLPAGLSCVAPDTTSLLLAQPKSTQTPMLAFAETVEFFTRSAGGAELPLQVKLRHEFDCKYKLELAGDIGGTTIDSPQVFGQIWVTRGGPVRKLLLPLELQFGDCSRITCEVKFDANDSLGKCSMR